MTTLDLFAGAGGWGAHLGIEIDDEVCATRRAAGIATIQADVARTNPLHLPDVPTGILVSAPCPPFSTAGTGKGVQDVEPVLKALEDLSEGRDSRRELIQRCQDPRSILSAEPLRWVLALKPEWTAWEQVVGAAPIWAYAAGLLAEEGYNVWTGLMDAYDYGVPQTRRRAVLMAHRSRLVAKPEPRPPRVMRDVLPWEGPDLSLRMGRSRGTTRTLDQPAPTIMFGKSPSGVAWWDGEEMVRPITIEEALLLQGFPADYPVQGGKVARFRQVGDAVPRGLADVIVEALA